MERIIVITDSIASLPSEKLNQYGIQVLPINISFGGRKYRDGVDLSASEAYRMLKEIPGQFFSSPPSVGECLEVYKEAAKHFNNILFITLSSKLSGMYNIALLAMKLAREESLNIPIEVVDSKSATVGEGLIVLAAAEAVANGRNLAEVKQAAFTVREKVKVTGIFETIQYVYRTGRIPKLTARFGSMLNIKPIFNIEEGKVHITGIIKNQEGGMKRIVRRMKEDIQGKPVHVAIAHAEALDAGKVLKEQIQAEFNCLDLFLTDFSPVMGYATGTGVLVVAYYC